MQVNLNSDDKVHGGESLAAWVQKETLDKLGRFAEQVTRVDVHLGDASAVHGVGGLPRVGYSPAAARHLLASYPEIVACHGQPAPPAVTDAPTPGPDGAGGAAM